MAAGQLPGQFIRIDAEKNTDKTNTIKWTYANELNIAQYSIERSFNGILYAGIGNKNAANNATNNSYNFIDLSGTFGTSYYRVKATSITGEVQYSAVVKVAHIDEESSFTVQPNPVVDKTLKIIFENMKGAYSLKLLTKQGATILSRAVTINSNAEVKTFVLSTDVSAGIYELVLVNEKGDQKVKSIYIQ